MPDNTTHNAADNSRSSVGRSNSAKVVHLEPDHQRLLRTQLTRLPAPVSAIHEKGKRLLLDLLQVYFDRADDSLFALADRAQSNVEQNLYFDSMREVRVQRRTIETQFSQAIDEAFAVLASTEYVRREEDSGLENVGAETLSLVSNDDLDEIVAVEATVAKANKQYGELIQQLSLRIDSQVPVKVFQKNNPLGPDIICDAFMAQAKKLNVGVKAKLVLFKLFDRDVINKLGPLYEAANDVLKEHNVLPSLSTQRRPVNPAPNVRSFAGAPSAQAGGSQAVTQGQANLAADSVDAATSDTVVAALKNIFGDQIEAPQAEGAAPSPQSAELLKLLSRAQHMPLMLSNNKAALNVRALLAQLQQQMGSKAQVGRVDDEVMNLVNLLFDFILEDRNLAVPMKALISRMQIPVLKVAIADKTFFTKGGHVARRLLNEMATASIGWQGTAETCAKDPLYRKIESIVTKLLEDFDSDVEIFHELLADFTGFLEKEKKRAAVLERRIVDAEDGKAKAEIARKTVAGEIAKRTKGQSLPDIVNHLINDAWSNVLFVTALKHGYESKDYQSALATLNELLLSVKTPETPQQRQALIALVPRLLKKLRTGLDTISYNPFEMSDLFKSLEKIHLACIRGKPMPEAKASAEPTPLQPEKSIPTSNIPQAAVQKPQTATASAKPVVADSAPTKAAEEITSKASPVEQEELPANDPHMEQVGRFVQGGWFDMKTDEGENLRCRLATYIKPTGKFIFVNRNGMKVAERNQNQLAHALKQGSLRVIDNSMLFDRALETVVTSLRKNN
ncbi:hypothetical protein TDB9533_00081 [Thalassocella blandensis]|nr:hypothetical protein TDB9533_00081 [Thalassocella blandensis]